MPAFTARFGRDANQLLEAQVDRCGTAMNRTRLARSLVALARSCHPGPVFAVSSAATGYAFASGGDFRRAIRAGIAVLFGQLAIGWQNDWTDASRDRLAGRVDKPIATDAVSRELVGAASLAAVVACVPTSLRNGRTAGVTHLVAVMSAASYNARLKSTPASFVPYAVSFSLLPIFVHQARPGASTPPAWAPIAAGSLGVAAHVLNVLPDRDLDREMGVLGLPQRLSHRQNLVLAEGLLMASSALISFGPRRPDIRSASGFVASLALAGAAIHSATARNDRRALRLVLVLALVDVMQLLFGARLVRSRS